MPTYNVLCQNYTGANFRGMDDATDSQLCKLTLTGEECNVIAYLLENCSYGADDEDCMNMKRYCKLMKKGDIPQFDGCGGVFTIEQDGKMILDMKEDFWNDEEDTSATVHEFSINVDEIKKKYDDLNRRLAEKLEA